MLRIDAGRIKKRCFKTSPEIMSELNGNIIDCDGLSYAYKNNGSKILAVAHLDTVIASNTFRVVKLDTETLIFSPMLDDRLGVYTIMDLLPKMGLKTDILLTDGEESGQTTAAHFKTDKQYNWIVEFDRRGDDVVTYQYTWDSTIRKYFKLGFGSFSDISELGSLGCQAVNVGIGYHNEHSHRCFFSDAEYVSQINKFAKFWAKEQNIAYPYKPRASFWEQGRLSSQIWNKSVPWDEWEEEQSEPVIICPYCECEFFEGQTLFGHSGPLCPECGMVVAEYDYRKI